MRRKKGFFEPYSVFKSIHSTKTIIRKIGRGGTYWPCVSRVKALRTRHYTTPLKKPCRLQKGDCFVFSRSPIRWFRLVGLLLREGLLVIVCRWDWHSHNIAKYCGSKTLTYTIYTYYNISGIIYIFSNLFVLF